MPEGRFHVDVVRGVPVVAGPEAIEIANASESRTALRSPPGEAQRQG